MADETRPSQITIEAGTLAAAIRTIARATGAEIITIEPGAGLLGVKRRTVSGDAGRALDQILKGSNLRAVRIGPSSFRIERRPQIAVRRPKARSARAVPPPVSDSSEPVIVVQGKFPTRLRDYPGSVLTSRLDGGAMDAQSPGSVFDLADRSPIVSSTAFGDGRDKVFIRGVADSSFNGASQPTTSVYFGDTLVGFGSPNPNLRLYDVSSVEVLEGPQGTLFGAGSEGGVIRVIPNPVNLAKAGGNAVAELSATQDGAPGWKLAATANLPLALDKVGVRALAFREVKGGFVDDLFRGNDVNRGIVSGGRASIAADMGADLRIEGGIVFQTTSERDAQFADRRLPTLKRAGSLAQPYGSDLLIGNLTLRKRWQSGLTLQSVISAGRRSTYDRFDASLGRIQATAYELNRNSSMISTETRLSATLPSGFAWVAGLAAMHVEDSQARALGVPDDTNPLDEVTNLTNSGSLFVQGRLNLLSAVELTLGLRFTLAQTDSRPSRGKSVSFIHGKLTHHFDPTLAVLWHITPNLAAYGRFQTSYRNGGVTVARGVGKVSEFDSDSIVMGEAGVRLSPSSHPGLTLSAAVSWADWSNIIAELVTQRGTPITANIGDGRIVTIEGSVDWQNGEGWSVGASVLATSDRLRGDFASQTSAANRLLPDVAKFAGNVRLQYSWEGVGGLYYSLGLNGRYIGRSVLGPGPFLDLDQGNYGVLDASARVRRGPLSLALTIDNLFDCRANRFALGNPVEIMRRSGFVPVRPRSVALSLALAY